MNQHMWKIAGGYLATARRVVRSLQATYVIGGPKGGCHVILHMVEQVDYLQTVPAGGLLTVLWAQEGSIAHFVVSREIVPDIAMSVFFLPHANQAADGQHHWQTCSCLGMTLVETHCCAERLFLQIGYSCTSRSRTGAQNRGRKQYIDGADTSCNVLRRATHPA